MYLKNTINITKLPNDVSSSSQTNGSKHLGLPVADSLI